MIKNKFLFSSLIFIYILFFLQIIFPVDRLLFLNKFSQHENFIITGVKYSRELGVTSYGMFPVGYVYKSKELNGFSVENNIYKATDELNKNYYLGSKLPNEVMQVRYSKSSGIVSRLIPFLISKTNIFKVDMYDYIRLFYLTISFLCFSIITIKIKKSYNYLSAFIFLAFNVLNSFFITNIYSLGSSYFYFALPFLVLSNDNLRKNIIYKKNYVIVFTMFFICLLAGRTQGYLPYFNFIMGILLFEKNSFNYIIKKKMFLVKNLLIFIFAYIFTEIITILQKILFLGTTYFDSLTIFLSSIAKYNLFNNSNSSIESCASGGLYNFLIEFFNIKMLDFFIFEIDLLIFFLITILLFFSTKNKNSQKMLLLSIVFLSINLFWFGFIKGAFLCHLHVYPRYLLFSYLPIISVALGSFQTRK